MHVHSSRWRWSVIQRYAKTAGVLLLLTIAAGFFGELYVPSKLVSREAATTAANITAHEVLFRFGFAAYLVEACCDIALALLFYVLLKPVSQFLALLSAFFGLVSTATFALTQLLYFVALPIQRGLQSFTPDQVASAAQMAVKLYGLGSGVFMVFYGIATLVRGYLMYRSTYFPRMVGGLLALAGLAFIVKSFTLVLAPAYASDFLLAPVFIATVILTGWLLIKGVDIAKWEEVTRDNRIQNALST
jgi:Domain of unknown function (DUF4386)